MNEKDSSNEITVQQELPQNFVEQKQDDPLAIQTGRSTKRGLVETSKIDKYSQENDEKIKMKTKNLVVQDNPGFTINNLAVNISNDNSGYMNIQKTNVDKNDRNNDFPINNTMENFSKIDNNSSSNRLSVFSRTAENNLIRTCEDLKNENSSRDIDVEVTKDDSNDNREKKGRRKLFVNIAANSILPRTRNKNDKPNNFRNNN